jgi:hypothetical protein
MILATAPLVVAVLLVGRIITPRGKPQSFGLGMSLGPNLSASPLFPDYSGLILKGCLTNRYPFPVHLSDCTWVSEDDHGRLTDAGAVRQGAQWTGLTNYRAPVRPMGLWNPALNTPTLLPNGAAATFFRIPANTRRARLFILYRYRAGFFGTLASKVLPIPSLNRWPKTRRWLDRHGLLGYYTGAYEGAWITNQLTAADGGISSQPIPGSAVRRR